MRTSDETDERSPLLQFPGSEPSYSDPSNLQDVYKHFCHLIGNRPADLEHHVKHVPPTDSLYHRAVRHRTMQGRTYIFTATLTNTLLLSQVVLGAALTGLGASNSSRVLITVFGALNTVIAGLIAFLKSRGQPMRARMFRDDLDRVVDEIENSATMWLGISKNIHGYDAIDTADAVTVRGEVARLTRLYDRAVKTSTLNDPDFYGTGGPSDPHSAALRARPTQPGAPVIPGAGPSTAVEPAPAPVAGPSVTLDPDESPATKAPTPTPPKEDAKDQKDDDKTAKAEVPKPADDKGKQPETPNPAGPESKPDAAAPATGAAGAEAAAVDDSPATAKDSPSKPADETTASPSEASKSTEPALKADSSAAS